MMWSKMGGIRKIRWEGFRWFSPGILLAVTAVSVMCYVGDICSDEVFVQLFEQGDLWGNALDYFMTGGIFLGVVSLCCVIFAGAGLYAQDYEENAVYMRIQRMGLKRYATFRVIQVSAVSWFLGCIGLLLALPVTALIFHIPMVPQEMAYLENDPSELLRSGHVLSFMVLLGILAGFRSLFYALLTFAISFLVPHRRVLAAIPMLLWYFNQYALCWIEWIPWYLQPRTLFNLQYVLVFDGVSEWEALGCVAVGMVVLAVVVWGLFVLHLRRNGIFGGEQNE